MNNLHALLLDLNMGDYIKIFKAQNIDLDALSTINIIRGDQTRLQIPSHLQGKLIQNCGLN